MIVALCCLVALAASATAPCDLTPERRASVVAAALQHLNAAGFAVMDNAGFVSFNSTCHEASPICLGENPSSPYGRYEMQSVPGQLPPELDDLDFPLWQIEPQGALIYYGCTPPRSRYFGVQSYAFISREHLLFASLSDSINLQTAQTTTGGDAPFGREWLVITTGDQKTDAAVRAAFIAAGVSPSAINDDILPDPKGMGLDPFGIGIGKTLYAWVYRVALCDDPAECHAYMHGGQPPVIRVFPKTAGTPDLYPVPPLRVRPTTPTEAAYQPTFANVVRAVAANLTATTHSKLMSTNALISFDIEGRTCIRELQNCVGATRDALYMDGDEPLRSGVGIEPNGPAYILPNTRGDFLVVVGVVHTDTHKATYTNLAAYDVDKAMGVLAVVDTTLRGSVSAFLPGWNGGNTTVFYLHGFARDCSYLTPMGLPCTVVPTAWPGVPLDKNVTFVERAYLEPGTAVGPNAATLIPPVILHFMP